MSRLSERRPVVSFVGVGVVLAILLIGGIYAAKNQLSSDNMSNVAIQTDEKTSHTSDDSSSEQQQISDRADSDENNLSDAPNDEASKDTGVAVDSSPDTDSDQDGNGLGMTSEDDETIPATGVSGTDELPQTGPSEVLISMLVLAVLAGVGVVYYRSERAKS